MLQKLTLKKNETLVEFASRICEVHDERTNQVTTLKNWIMRNPDVVNDRWDEFVDVIAESLIQRSCNISNQNLDRRVRAWNEMDRRNHAGNGKSKPKLVEGKKRTDSKARMEAIAESRLGEFMSMRIGGKNYRDCRKKDLICAAANERKRGAGHLRNAIFAEKSAAGLKSNNQKVSARYKSAEELKEMWNQASKEAERITKA